MAVLPTTALHLSRHASEGARDRDQGMGQLPQLSHTRIARLGRTLRAWRAQVLAYFDTSGVSNGGTEAINLTIEKVRRLAHGFRDLIIIGYESCLPPTDADPTELARTMPESEDPIVPGLVAGTRQRPETVRVLLDN
jgi:N-methylhydantoinase A/oxoprolinase/acetone carboxylase beta subunit